MKNNHPSLNEGKATKLLHSYFHRDELTAATIMDSNSSEEKAIVNCQKAFKIKLAKNELER
jgi:hypothetical protein